MATTDKEVNELIKREYEHGFVTDIEADTFEPGLNEDVIARLSAIKKEPEWMREWRLKAYRRWLEMDEPDWAHVGYPKIDYNSISYYSAPKRKEDMPQSLDEVDPELLKTYEKLGIPLHEREKLAGVAVDAVFDSVSVATTFKEEVFKHCASAGANLMLMYSKGKTNTKELLAEWARLGKLFEGTPIRLLFRGRSRRSED